MLCNVQYPLDLLNDRVTDIKIMATSSLNLHVNSSPFPKHIFVDLEVSPSPSLLLLCSARCEGNHIRTYLGT